MNTVLPGYVPGQGYPACRYCLAREMDDADDHDEVCPRYKAHAAGVRDGVLAARDHLRSWWDDGDQGNANDAAELVLLTDLANRLAPTQAEPDPKDVPITRPWKTSSPDFQEGYRAGWADRESDLLCAVDRIKPSPSDPVPVECWNCREPYVLSATPTCDKCADEWLDAAQEHMKCPPPTQHVDGEPK